MTLVCLVSPVTHQPFLPYPSHHQWIRAANYFDEVIANINDTLFIFRRYRQLSLYIMLFVMDFGIQTINCHFGLHPFISCFFFLKAFRFFLILNVSFCLFMLLITIWLPLYQVYSDVRNSQRRPVSITVTVIIILFRSVSRRYFRCIASFQ